MSLYSVWEMFTFDDFYYPGPSRSPTKKRPIWRAEMMGELEYELEPDIDSMPRHASRHSGLDSMFFKGQSGYNRSADRSCRNRNENQGRSMARRKWKRELGTRRDRRWYRDHDGEMLADCIYVACLLIVEDRSSTSA